MNKNAIKATLFRLLPQIGLLLVIIVLCCFFAYRDMGRPHPVFMTLETPAQLFKYYSPMAMLALGMTLIILTGGIDLSVGFVMMLLMFIMAAPVRDHPGINPFLVLGGGLIASFLISSFIGGAVAFARIPSFVVSLAMMVMTYGITILISKNQAISGLPDSVMWLGRTEFTLFGTYFPITMLFVFAAYVSISILLNKTTFGRHLYAVGSNREAARLSGIRVPVVEMCAYIISGLCVWIAGVMQMGINRTADPKVALSDNLELNAIAIVVIGGTSLSGGRGTISGTALGALLLALIFNGLPLIGYTEPSTKKIIQGSIILVGAVLDAVQRRYRKES